MNKQLNPFQSDKDSREMQSSDEQRAVQEVQAAMVIAKRFPRDQMAAMDRILTACSRPTLAESAVYAYPRGGQTVTGPSIRLAEAMAQSWGNISFGIRELSQSGGESIVEAFAWDLETNSRQVKVFSVPHKRKARGEITTLSDPRDIYELVANQGARRLRACILGIIPGDVTDAAVRQCEITQQHSTGVPLDEIKKLITAFKQFDVTEDMLRRRLGHNLDSTISAEVIALRKIYASIRDGMSKPDQWFEIKNGVTIERLKATEPTTDQAVMDIVESSEPEPQEWPKWDVVSGHWFDSDGVSYAPDVHVNGNPPPVTNAGCFRARRGKAAKATELANRSAAERHADPEANTEAQPNDVGKDPDWEDADKLGLPPVPPTDEKEVDDIPW